MNGRIRDPIRIPGEADPDRNRRVGICAEFLRERGEKQIAALFVDSAYGAPSVERLLTMGFRNVQEVHFGDTTTPVTVSGKAIDQRSRPGEVLDVLPENMRAYIVRCFNSVCVK